MIEAGKPRVRNSGGGNRKQHIARAIGKMVVRNASKFIKSISIPSRVPSTFLGWWWIHGLAKENLDWRPLFWLEAILEEIAEHAEAHPSWLEMPATTE